MTKNDRTIIKRVQTILSNFEKNKLKFLPIFLAPMRGPGAGGVEKTQRSKDFTLNLLQLKFKVVWSNRTKVTSISSSYSTNAYHSLAMRECQIMTLTLKIHNTLTRAARAFILHGQLVLLIT